MIRLSPLKLFALSFILLMTTGTGYAITPDAKPFSANVISGASPQKKKSRVKRPVSAQKAQKKAEAKDKQRRKESDRYIEENRKRSVEIQTPEVQERMKQNVKDANAQYKAKKKNNSSRTKKAGRKYR